MMGQADSLRPGSWGRWRPLLLLAAAVVASRVVLILSTGSFRHPNLWEYEVIATNLLAGRGFSFPWLGTIYRSYNPPMYNFICAGVYALTGHSHFAILVVQACFTALLCVTIWALGCRVASPRVGWLAAVLVGLHPGLAYYDVFQVIPLTFDAWLFALMTLAMLRCWERPTRLRLLGAGVCLGVSALSRGSGTLFIIPAALWLGWVRRSPWRAFGRQAGVLGLGMMLVVGPWVVRNCLVHGRLTPWVNTTVGELLWMGNNPQASGSAYHPSGAPILELAPPEFLAELKGLDELGQKAAFEREAWRFIRHHPGRFVQLTLMKFAQFWGSAPQRGLLYPRRYLHVYLWYYGVMVALAMLGLISLGRWPPTPWTRGALWLIALLMLTVSLTHSVFYVEGRHRWGVEPLLLVLASAGIWAIQQRLQRHPVPGRHERVTAVA